MSERTFVDRQRRRALVRLALLCSDTVMLLAATITATYVRFERLTAIAKFENVAVTISYHQVGYWLLVVWIGALHLEHLYDLDRVFAGSGELTRVARALSVGVVAFILVTFGLKMPGLSRAWTLIALGLAVLFVSAGRLVVRASLHLARERGRLLRPTLVVGYNEEAAEMIRIIARNPGAGLVPVGYLATTQEEYQHGAPDRSGVPCLGFAREVLHVVRSTPSDTVIVASSAFSHEVMARIIAELRGAPVDVHVSSGLYEVLTSRVIVREVSGIPLMTIKGVSLSWQKQLVKRAFDLVVAGLITIVGMPVWLAIMAAIKLDSPGPIFFKQARVGKSGEAFGMFKFRSMRDDAEAMLAQLVEENEASGPLFKMRDDPRVTRVGRWMRKFSIDEFPQLLNVLNGDMSLVGPRPPLIHETEKYTAHHWRRLEVLPGMTGLWQVSGRSNLTFEEMVRLDIFYIENWSVGLDIALMARTVPAVLLTKGAY